MPAQERKYTWAEQMVVVLARDLRDDDLAVEERDMTYRLQRLCLPKGYIVPT